MENLPDSSNGEVLRLLKEDGVDLSQPLEIEFAVNVPNEGIGNSVVQALVDGGYSSELEYDVGEVDSDGKIDTLDPCYGPSWSVYVRRRMIPLLSDIDATENRIIEIVSPIGGEFDGWGTTV